MLVSYTLSPIGVVRSPFDERSAAPRQAALAAGVVGRIELLPDRGFEFALEGVGSWARLWVVFVFHRNVEQARGWKPKVLPPRSDRKQGVFATRSPHRPNPIGLSVVRVERVEGLTVHVRDLDLLDGTPVLDLKPYVAYADAFPEGRAGWLEARDPVEPWGVSFSDRAQAQIAWLQREGVELQPVLSSALALGPQPHPYRRIRVRGALRTLSWKEWRVDFEVSSRQITVRELRSGYRVRQLADGSAPALHRAFVDAFTVR